MENQNLRNNLDVYLNSLLKLSLINIMPEIVLSTGDTISFKHA